jgi:hypothetical protein
MLYKSSFYAIKLSIKLNCLVLSNSFVWNKEKSLFLVIESRKTELLFVLSRCSWGLFHFLFISYRSFSAVNFDHAASTSSARALALINKAALTVVFQNQQPTMPLGHGKDVSLSMPSSCSTSLYHMSKMHRYLSYVVFCGLLHSIPCRAVQGNISESNSWRCWQDG